MSPIHISIGMIPMIVTSNNGFKTLEFHATGYQDLGTSVGTLSSKFELSLFSDS